MSDVDGRIADLFDQALDLPAAERLPFIERSTQDEPEVRSAVMALLQHDEDMPSSFLAGEQTSPAVAPAASATLPLPESIGGYGIVGVIGSGGMGVIYEAEQQSPRRRVALKVIRPGLVSEEVVRRFRSEAQILGYLQHPGIAQIYEAQVARVGGSETPFLAMELVRGERIDVYARGRRFQTPQIVELVARVCDAVHHAHQKGVLHRDLKPSNILVSELASSLLAGEMMAQTGSSVAHTDSVGQPKVLDFGVARVTDADLQVETMQTQEGQIIGTLSYMSPEQVRGANNEIDIRSDVYALGVVMFELLTGQLPHNLQGLSFIEAARRIQEEPPQRATMLDARLRGDLDTILQKALERDRERRYGSAADLAADLRRYLRHEPILARPPSMTYQLRKFASRNRALVFGAVSTVAMLVLGTIGTGVGWVSAVRALDDLEASNKQLKQTNEQLQETRSNLEDIAAFQANQLASVDVPEMGTQLREALRDSVPAEEQEALDELLSDINFTDVARDTLQDNVLLPSRDVLNREFADQPLVRGDLLQSLARTLRVIGAPNAALPIQEEALAVRREALGPTARDTAYSMSQTATLLQEMGRYTDAEALYREALEAGNHDPATPTGNHAVDLGNLGLNLVNQGRNEEAEEYLRESYRIATEAEVEKHVLSAAAALSQLLGSLGRSDEAEVFHKEVIEGRTRLFGADSVETVRAKANLAVFYGRLGRSAEGEAILRDVLEVRTRVFGKDHPVTLQTMSNLAMALQEQSKFPAAQELLEQALEVAERDLGPDNRYTLRLLNTLASVLDARDLLDEAEAMYAESLARHRRVYGEDHPDSMLALGNYGYIVNLQGRGEEALPIYREAYERLKGRYGIEHPGTLTSMGNLAALLTQLGKEEEADPLYKLSLETRQRVLGPEHPSTLNAIFNMGHMLRGQGRLDEAEPYCEDALRLYRKVAGPRHIGTLHSLYNLGLLRQDQQRYEEAEQLLNESLAGWRSVHGDDHQLVRRVKSYLGELFEEMERWEEAAEIWNGLLADARTADRPAWRIIAALRSLGGVYVKQGAPEQAVPLFEEALERVREKDDAVEMNWLVCESELGEALSYRDDREPGEALLRSSFERLVEITEASDDQEQLKKARQRLLDYYERSGQPEKGDPFRT